MAILRWRDIGEAPAEPGVYAWYYMPEITNFDLKAMVNKVNCLKSEGDLTGATQHVRQFLDQKLFSYFREQPYLAVIRAPLKPRYEGALEHQSSVSTSLINRLVEDPQRIETVKDILEKSAPLFASPIYIGMSEKLRSRLNKHKNLIESYGGLPTNPLNETDERDHNFAREVRARNIPPPRLFVVIQTIENGSDAFIDVENILNRIHYPLFGRN